MVAVRSTRRFSVVYVQLWTGRAKGLTYACGGGVPIREQGAHAPVQSARVHGVDFETASCRFTWLMWDIWPTRALACNCRSRFAEERISSLLLRSGAVRGGSLRRGLCDEAGTFYPSLTRYRFEKPSTPQRIMRHLARPEYIRRTHEPKPTPGPQDCE